MFFRKNKLALIKTKVNIARDNLYEQREWLLRKLLDDENLTAKDVIYLTTDIYNHLLDKLKEIEEELEEC